MAYTAKISELASRYTWASVLAYDQEYRRRHSAAEGEDGDTNGHQAAWQAAESDPAAKKGACNITTESVLTDRCVTSNTCVCCASVQAHPQSGAGIAQWLERRTRDGKVAGANPCRSDGRIFFSRVSFLCWLLFRYPFHPRVTAVARKRPRSFCQKCRWQVTAKHAYTLRMWLCMNWHGAWLYGVHRTRWDGSSFM